MANNYRRALVIGVIGVASWALVAGRTPRPAASTPSAAPVMPAIYAPPVERVETHVLERGQTLTGLLSRASITGADLEGLIGSLRKKKDLRQLAAGIQVVVRRRIADGEASAVDLRLNPDSTVHMVRADSGWASRVVVTPTVLDTAYVAGTIAQGKTLYEALTEDDDLEMPSAERAQLVSDLAEIYAYKLDFSHEIQPGDAFRIVYERQVRPDGTARSRRILAAEMDAKGKSFRAFFYTPPHSEHGSYYDAEGNSMKRGFRMYPVDYVRITSTFSWKRYHPILGIYRAHLGTDFGAAKGTPVKATADGTVKSAGRAGGYGNMIELRHSNGYTTRYAHLSRFAKGLHRGEHVSQGEVIGYVGATGLATGPHLHYELRHNGKAVDMRSAKLPVSGSLTGAEKRAFEGVVTARTALLEQAAQARTGAHLAQAARPQGARANGSGE